MSYGKDKPKNAPIQAISVRYNSFAWKASTCSPTNSPLNHFHSPIVLHNEKWNHISIQLRSLVLPTLWKISQFTAMSCMSKRVSTANSSAWTCTDTFSDFQCGCDLCIYQLHYIPTYVYEYIERECSTYTYNATTKIRSNELFIAHCDEMRIIFFCFIIIWCVFFLFCWVCCLMPWKYLQNSNRFGSRWVPSYHV